MRRTVFILIACYVVATQAWSGPFYPVQRAPARMRFTRYAPAPPLHRLPVRVMSRSRLPAEHHKIPVQEPDESEYQRQKRGHDDYNYDHDHDHESHGTKGVTGPVHTFVKTDKNANYKWGVRHHVGNKYAS